MNETKISGVWYDEMTNTLFDQRYNWCLENLGPATDYPPRWQPTGTGIGNAGSNNAAEIDVYMRYANGMFACNPTVRVQSLQYPEFISWELL